MCCRCQVYKNVPTQTKDMTWISEISVAARSQFDCFWGQCVPIVPNKSTPRKSSRWLCSQGILKQNWSGKNISHRIREPAKIQKPSVTFKSTTYIDNKQQLTYINHHLIHLNPWHSLTTSYHIPEIVAWPPGVAPWRSTPLQVSHARRGWWPVTHPYLSSWQYFKPLRSDLRSAATKINS